MYFNKSYITTKGKQLIDKLASGDGTSKKVVWTTAATSALQYSQLDSSNPEGEINSLTDIKGYHGISSYSSTGNIISAERKSVCLDAESDATTEVLAITSELHNSQECNGYAYCYGIWAKIEDDDEFGADTLVAVAFWDFQSGTPDKVPNCTSEAWKAMVDLYIVINSNAAQSVSAGEGWYPTLRDFVDLKDRVVTWHSTTSTTAGDNQTIYGVKTFNSPIKVLTGTSAFVNATATELSAQTIIATTADIEGQLTTRNIIPEESNTYKIGSSDKTYNSIHSTSIYCEDIYSPNGARSIKFNSRSITLYSNYTTGTTTDIANAPSVSIAGNIVPASDNVYILGSKNFRLGHIYATKTFSNDFYGTFNGSLNGNAASAKTVGLRGCSTNSNYPLVFANGTNSSTSSYANTSLYTDTATSLYYNPYSNKLTAGSISVGNISCTSISAQTVEATDIDVSDDIICKTISADSVTAKSLSVPASSKATFYEGILKDLGLWECATGSFTYYYVYYLDRQSQGGSAVDSSYLQVGRTLSSTSNIAAGASFRTAYFVSVVSNLTASQVASIFGLGSSVQDSSYVVPSGSYRILNVISLGKFYGGSSYANGSCSKVLCRKLS